MNFHSQIWSVKLSLDRYLSSWPSFRRVTLREKTRWWRDGAETSRIFSFRCSARCVSRVEIYIIDRTTASWFRLETSVAEERREKRIFTRWRSWTCKGDGRQWWIFIKFLSSSFRIRLFYVFYCFPFRVEIFPKMNTFGNLKIMIRGDLN